MKLAVFDLDGTLIDSLADIAEATNFAMRKLGFPEHPLNEFNYMVGDGVKILIERALPDDRQELFEQALKLYNDYYNENYTVKTYVYKGITETLKQLKAMGIKLAVASNKTHCFTEVIIKNYFGNDTFDAVYGKFDARPVKPDPAILNAILSDMSIAPSEAIMIGDTSIDINTGKNAGVRSIGCLWGFRSMEELTSAGADFRAEKPEDIVKFIREI